MRRTNNKEPKNINIGASIKKYILFAVAGILVISSVFMTVETATSGVEVSNLRQKEVQLSAEKRNLEGNLVQSISMNDLTQKGNEMGYVKPTSMVYVTQTSEAMARLP